MSWGVTPASIGREFKAVLTERFSIIYSYVLVRTWFCLSLPQHWSVEVLRSKHFVLPEENWNWPSPPILSAPALPGLFWSGRFLSGCIVGLFGGFVVFFIFDFCACLCNVVSGDCCSSPPAWESDREKDSLY